MTVDIICADARDALARFPDGHFHCCVTSPPFWGLRDYGLEPTVWGNPEPVEGCEHEWGEPIEGRSQSGALNGSTLAGTPPGQERRPQWTSAFCRRCGAWRGTLGLEPTPELYVEHLVAVMREVRRVLRDDGVLWLNLGDSYNAAGRDGHGTRIGYKQGTNRPSASGADGNRPTASSLKPKDLVGIPWRVAFALQTDGWWLRSDIIWSKPNPMPESVRDRPTRSHEYLFLLAKAERYFWDQDAVREPHQDVHRPDGFKGADGISDDSYAPRTQGWDGGGMIHRHRDYNPAGRNRRSVWEIATQPFPGAHFAVFPEKLVEPCILAGTSEWGCCPECGAPWERLVEKGLTDHDGVTDSGYPKGTTAKRLAMLRQAARERGSEYQNETQTIGWRPTCDHGAEPVPCRVLDPFAGSGTVGMVTERLGRHSVLIDAKEEYCEMARHRTAQRGLMAEAAS